MSNTFNSIQLIAREMLPRLVGNLLMPNLMYRDYSKEYAKEGATIQIEVPPVFSANEFDRSSGISIQNVNIGSVPVTLDKIADVSVELTAEEMVYHINDKRRASIMDGMAVALAEKINSDCMNLYKNVPYFGGAAGTTPDGLDDFAAIRKLFNDKKAPQSPRNVIWDTAADAKFVQLSNLVKVNEAGSPMALREGEIGRVHGLNNYTAQDVKYHTTGIAGTPLIDLVAGYAVGTTTIHVDGLTTKASAGDLITIGGYQYVVVSCSDLATTDADMVIYPGLQAAAANDDPITIVASHRANLAFLPQAFAFVTRPLPMPSDKLAHVVSYNDISLRVVEGYDQKYKKNTLSVDILYGLKTVYPELAVRYLG